MKLTTKSLKSYIGKGPNWHYEIHHGSPTNKYSSVWRIDHFGLPNKLVIEFSDYDEESVWLNKQS